MQVASFVPLMYMCLCTYYSLFRIGMLTFYSLTPWQTSSVSLLMICSMVARYAPPISYNFLNLIQLDNGAKTIFEKRMGNIDDAVPFFGKGFNKIYPLIMVIYTILIGSNFFDRVVSYFGNWKIFRFLQEEADDSDGFDSSGIIILKRERSWLEQGHKVGELIIPLARNFNNHSMDVESSTSVMVSGEAAQPGSSRESIGKKYTALRTKTSNQERDVDSIDNRSTKAAFSQSNEPSSQVASTWESVKTGFQKLKSNIDAKKFVPLRQIHEATHSRVSSSESLDEIFERIKRPMAQPRQQDYDSDNDMDS